MESARLKNLRDSIDTSSILFNLAIFIFSFHPTYTHTTYTAKRVGKRERERERQKKGRWKERENRESTQHSYIRVSSGAQTSTRFHPLKVWVLRVSAGSAPRLFFRFVVASVLRGSRSLLVYPRINRRVNEFLGRRCVCRKADKVYARLRAK